MAGPLSTPFDNAVVTPPGTGEDFAALKGGVDLPGGVSPVTSPFNQAIVSAPGNIHETPNSLSGLPQQVELIEVEGAPARGATVTSDGVYAPGIPSGSFGK